MEQPQGNCDDLQPQDLSTTCSRPTVIDLTGRSEECPQKANRTVRSPSWYSNSGSSKGLPFPETVNDHRLPTGDQVQPDNAFSNTTVTLSYVSRSHVFPTRDTIAQQTPLYGVPSISRFSLQGTGETGDAHLCKDMNLHYQQQANMPLDLASSSQPLTSVSPSLGASEHAAGVCRMQQLSLVLNGEHASSNGAVVRHKSRSSPQHGLSQEAAGCRGGLLNSPRSRSLSGVGVDPLPDAAERQKRGDSEVVFLFSRTEEPVLVQAGLSSRDLCALGRDYVSPLEDPRSPSATSLDDTEDVFILPRASCSPSTGSASWDELQGAGQRTGPSPDTPRLHSSKAPPTAAHTPTAALLPVIDLTDDSTPPPEALEAVARETDTSSPLNGNAQTSQKSFERKKLPPRSGRGTRLEAIVMNINPNWYKVSRSVSANKRATASQNRAPESKAVRPRKDTLSEGQNKVQAKAFLPSETETKLHLSARLQKGKSSIYVNKDSCKESTSDSEPISFRKYPHITSPKTSSPLTAIGKGSEENESKPSMSRPEPTSYAEVTGMSTPPTAGQIIPPSHEGVASGSKVPPIAKSKATPPPKRKRKKHNGPQSSMFSPKEPEIKLKYVNYKEEKRDVRMMDTFSPFIRMERRQSPSTCKVINYPEEDQPRLKKGQQQQSSLGSFVPGAVPTSSCLQLGRVSNRSQYQNSLVCCLCGGSANAMDLGDLHGPYFPEAYRPSAKTPAGSTTGLKEDEDSDSDSSCSVRGRGRKLARTHGPGPRLNQEGLLGNHPTWTGDTDPSGSPATKRARTEAGCGPVALVGARALEDWYSPPVVPLEPCEYWLHEDCSIWAAGVFLVKGRVYGLEEAVRVAQETMCSGCHDPGATLGCFFKGCPNKYHYQCALQSDCVLIEENFSMKCRKHKNKSFNPPSGNRRDRRGPAPPSGNRRDRRGPASPSGNRQDSRGPAQLGHLSFPT